MALNEGHILERWKTFGYIYALKEDLVETLEFLAKNNAGSVVLKVHGDGWFIQRLY